MQPLQFYLKGILCEKLLTVSCIILIHFDRLVMEVWSKSPGRSISPRAMVNSIRRVGKQFRNCRQEDAHEYLRELVNCMHEESLKANRLKLNSGDITETTLMSRVFGGHLCNVLKCLKCKHTSKTYNHFQDLSVDVTHGVRTVSDAIALFIKPEKLGSGNEWNCDGCKRKVPVRCLIFAELYRCCDA
jgi:ubiquitin carboxyl-terminal hydrolase 36/42